MPCPFIYPHNRLDARTVLILTIKGISVEKSHLVDRHRCPIAQVSLRQVSLRSLMAGGCNTVITREERDYNVCREHSWRDGREREKNTGI
jgi:hypothetical protein